MNILSGRKRYLSLVIVLLVLAAMLPLNLLAGQPKVSLCHLNGNGVFIRIDIGNPAMQSHLNHGDGVVGEVFDGECNPIPPTLTPTPVPPTDTPTVPGPTSTPS